MKSIFFEYDLNNIPIEIIELKREDLEFYNANTSEQSYKNVIVVILNDENLGFAKGNNVGIRYVIERVFEYVFLLNNDIQALWFYAVQPGSRARRPIHSH